MSINGYLTIKDLIEDYDKTYTQVYYLIRIGKIKTERVGWQYLIPVSSIPEEWTKKN
jgi:hypothetical protein